LAQGLVRVNGDVETRRGRQLAAGDVVECAGRRVVIATGST
jgi:ribosome-associated protein